MLLNFKQSSGMVDIPSPSISEMRAGASEERDSLAFITAPDIDNCPRILKIIIIIIIQR